MRYAVVIEKAHEKFSAYVPDLPGCVATGNNEADVEIAVQQAIGFHLEGMLEDGAPVSPPSSRVNYVEVAAFRLVHNRSVCAEGYR